MSFRSLIGAMATIAGLCLSIASSSEAQCGTGGSCYSAQVSPFCNDAACCEAVCAVDGFCCFNSWDATCVEEAQAICLTCGGAGAGDCFTTGAAACNDQECCEAVCADDPFCCSNSWDQVCVSEAIVRCKTCGGVGAGSCFAQGGPTCNDAECCNAVCSLDAYCCSTAWDATCVNEAIALCQSCGGIGAGDCFTVGGPWCNDADCCSAVCAIDPSCCSTAWDADCVASASDVCVAEVVLGPKLNFANGNFYYLLERSIWPKAELKAVALGGHLVTINDADENQWVFANLVSASGPRPVWIGLNDLAVQGTFAWVSGQPVGFTAWGAGEPNNLGGDERFVEMFAGSPIWNDNDLTGTGSLDNFAVVEVEAVGCGDATAGECFVPHTGVGCSDAACCLSTCTADPFCCQSGWDVLCANYANATCGGCGDPTTGSCTSVHGPYCSNFSCCQSVCSLDPFCCETSWDMACVNSAILTCLGGCVGDIDGNGVVDGADLGLLLSSWGQISGGPGDVNLDGVTDGADLGDLLSHWGGC